MEEITKSEKLAHEVEEVIEDKAGRLKIYIITFLKWIFYALIVGAICGLVGTAFHYCVNYATAWREANPWLLYLLPVSGILIVFCYRANGVKKDEGTNLIIASVRESNDVPANMTFLIFIGTVLTHLCGGSAGREGAALQIGGSLGSMIGRILHLDENEKKMIITIGMAGLFSALFGTPLAAAVFSMEVIMVGSMNYAVFLPGIISAVTATSIAESFHVETMSFTTGNIPAFDLITFAKVGGLAVVCALVSWIFIKTMHASNKLFTKYIKNQYLRIAVGGFIIIMLTVIIGNRDYNGVGLDIIETCMVGRVVWYAFALKILFTAITMGCGFKGGEIIPSFFIGATLGNALGLLLGLDPAFAAAIGLISVFCSVVNCPMAAVILSIELFGGNGILYFALSCAICFIASGYSSLYASQDFVFSKVPLDRE